MSVTTIIRVPKVNLKTRIKKVNGNLTVHYALDIESFADYFIPFLKSHEALKTVVSLETKETSDRGKNSTGHWWKNSTEYKTNKNKKTTADKAEPQSLSLSPEIVLRLEK